MFELILILSLVLVGLIVLGLFFKGESWKPSVTWSGKRYQISIGVPQVAFSITSVPVDASPAPPPAQ